MTIMSITNKIDGKVNPIAVKELRQAVQGRFVVGIMLLFLAVSVAVMGFVAADGDSSSNFNRGRDVFMWIYGILLAATLVLVPMYVMVRLSFERNSDNLDLLFTTTMKPGAIIRGKIWSAMILGGLMFAACLPFLTISYMLRGIDLPTIFFLVLLALAAMMVCVQVAVFVGCIAITKGLKSLIALAMLAGMISLCSGLMFMVHQIISSGLQSFFSGSNVWWGVSAFMIIIMLVLGLLYVLSIAMVSAPTSNRALPVRSYITGLWVILLSFLAIAAHYNSDWDVFYYLILSIIVPLLWLMMLGSVSERAQPGPRILHKVPERRWLRPMAFYFYSGAAGGVAWSLTMLLLTFILSFGLDYGLGTLSSYSLDDFITARTNMLCITLYICSYSLTALGLRQKLFSRFIKPIHTWVLAVGLMTITMVIQLTVVISSNIKMDFRQSGAHIWLALNPVGILWRPGQQDFFLTVAGIWLAIAMIFTIPWMVRQYQNFKPIVKTEMIN